MPQVKNDNITDYSKINYAKMLNKYYFVSYETIQNKQLASYRNDLARI